MTICIQILARSAAVSCLASCAGLGFGQVQFFEIPPLTGAQNSIPMGVSGDGSVVFGHSGFIEGVDHAFRWTVGGGPEDLGTQPNTSTSFWEIYYAYAANDDGSTIVGVYADPVGSGEVHAFRWRAGVGMEDLGIGGGDNLSAANGINADGTVIVGATSFDGAFRWTADGIEYLGFGAANAVSSDGNVVVGSSGSRAERWTRQGGIQDIGGFSPVGCSSDGTVIVGTETGTQGPAIADRWIEGVGTARLTLPWNAANAFPEAISGDGQTVVGDFVQGDVSACSWIGDAPAINLNQFLASHGITLDWTLASALGISRNGRVIVGAGLRNGHYLGWMIRIGPHCGSADFNHDGDVGTDADIDAFFGVLAGNSCNGCEGADFNGDGDVGTDADIEAFFRVLAGGSC